MFARVYVNLLIAAVKVVEFARRSLRAIGRRCQTWDLSLQVFEIGITARISTEGLQKPNRRSSQRSTSTELLADTRLLFEGNPSTCPYDPDKGEPVRRARLKKEAEERAKESRYTGRPLFDHTTCRAPTATRF